MAHSRKRGGFVVLSHSRFKGRFGGATDPAFLGRERTAGLYQRNALSDLPGDAHGQAGRHHAHLDRGHLATAGEDVVSLGQPRLEVPTRLVGERGRVVQVGFRLDGEALELGPFGRVADRPVDGVDLDRLRPLAGVVGIEPDDHVAVDVHGLDLW
jgi:hypothetical protein